MSDPQDNLDAERSGSVQSAPDRRMFPRVPHRAVFDIRPLGQGEMGEAIPVVLQDLSIAGMGILHASAMTVGQTVQVPLTGPTGRDVSVMATVVRCEQLDDGLYSIGFQFMSSAVAADGRSRQQTGQPARRE